MWEYTILLQKTIVIPHTFENEDVFLRISKTAKRVHT